MAIAVIVGLSATRLIATTWDILSPDALVQGGSEVIVVGEITSVEKVANFDNRVEKRIGIIAVSEIIYSTGVPKTIRIEMDSRDHGNDFKLGDRGVWFLRRVTPSSAQQMVMETGKFAPPLVGLKFDSETFEADHPSTFWRAPEKEDAAKAKKMVVIRWLAHDRRSSDERYLSEALRVTTEELKAQRAVQPEKK